MSSQTGEASIPLEETPLAGVTTVVDKKAPVLFGALTIALLVIVLLAGESGDTTFRLATGTDFFEVPEITVPAVATAWLMVVICALCTALALSW